jgi:hypothetical protein
MSTTYDDQQFQAATTKILALTLQANGTPVRHDASHPHTTYLEQVALRNGLTPDRYPALFARLQRGATPANAPRSASPNTGAFVDGQFIDYVAPLTNASLTASGHALITRTAPIANTFVAMSVVNVDPSGKQTILASGANQTYLRQTTEVQTDDRTAQPLPSTGQTYGVISWSIEYADGTIDASSVSSQWAFQAEKDPTVTAPAIRPDRHTGDLNDIVVGLSRGFNSPANNTDIDYWFWQDQWAQTTLLVPFVGSMYFTKPIAPLGSANPQLFFYLARSEGGMSELKATDVTRYLSGFSIDQNDPKRLNFSLQATQTAAGNAINFGVSPWVADTRTFFTARVVVTLNDFSLGWSSVLSSTQPETNEVDGVAYIKPIVYVWHCLAAGTLIQMSDGTKKAIELLNAGDQVKSSGGDVQVVQATLAQPHWGDVLVVSTQKGYSITCSRTHAMVTPSGTVQAGSLAVGMPIFTTSGVDTVASITTRQQQGDGLFNLWLAGPKGQTVFYANDFLVGDYQMQVALLDPSSSEVQARLPEHLRQDHLSWVADQSQDAR